MITPRSRRLPEVYSDFRKDLLVSPVTDDLARKVDEEAVKDSIRNLVLTDRGERPFNRRLGCDVRRMLFENVMPDTFLLVQEMITETIENYEPRANLIGVYVNGSPDVNAVLITIVFSIINKEEPVTLAMTVERVR